MQQASPINLTRIAQLVPVTEAEGPGKRCAIWFQGCPLRCAECCNPEMLSFEGGRETTLEALLDEVEQARQLGSEGITLLGGEPFAHLPFAAQLAAAVQGMGMSVMVFSGYTLEEIQAWKQLDADRLLKHTDILVDGPYLRDQPESARRWIGSANQRIHFLSDRYREDDPCWQINNTVELRLDGGAVTINGFPTTGVQQWTRQARHRAKRGE